MEMKFWLLFRRFVKKNTKAVMKRNKTVTDYQTKVLSVMSAWQEEILPKS